MRVRRPQPRWSRGMVPADVLILLVAFALLLAVVVPEISAARRRSAQAAVRADLRRLAAAQESYFYDHRVYSADPAELRVTGYQPSADVRIVVREATQMGWSAVASHPEAPAGCFVFVRDAAPVGPATRPGEIRCS